MIMGGMVPVVNLQGIKPGQLTLDGETVAGIFLGEITQWDDPKIKALNPGVNLPSKAIAVVHRSDGSGTTFLFTNYLSQRQRRLVEQGRRQHARSNGRSASAPRAMKASPAT